MDTQQPTLPAVLAAQQAQAIVLASMRALSMSEGQALDALLNANVQWALTERRCFLNPPQENMNE